MEVTNLVPLLRHHSTALLHPMHYYSARVILSELTGNLYGDSRSWAGLGWQIYMSEIITGVYICLHLFCRKHVRQPRCQMSSGESSRKELCNSMSSSGGVPRGNPSLQGSMAIITIEGQGIIHSPEPTAHCQAY